MNKEAKDLWERAKKSLTAAQAIADKDPDSSASRAYYAAFHAVSALFALQKKEFTKHSALEAAVHRDLVKAGLWSEDLGKDFSWLVAIRSTGDYGGSMHVSGQDATMAIEKSIKIISAVQNRNPEIFT
jgi:uncharacterized protein (UPF0332 family)